MKKKIITLLVFLLILCGCENKTIYQQTTNSQTQYYDNIPEEDSTRYLILVNKDNRITEEDLKKYQLVNIESYDGTILQLEKETYINFLALQEDLKNQNTEISIREGYRTIDDQQYIWDLYLKEKGEAYTKKYVAVPGYSEHHTGLALDLIPKSGDDFVVDPEEVGNVKYIYATIHKTLPKYGFILRYPKGKEEITGYDYEPWHLRYVGKEVAQEIYNNNLTLEEYLTNQTLT